jgi:hypothetical protein
MFFGLGGGAVQIIFQIGDSFRPLMSHEGLWSAGQRVRILPKYEGSCSSQKQEPSAPAAMALWLLYSLFHPRPFLLTGRERPVAAILAVPSPLSGRKRSTKAQFLPVPKQDNDDMVG